MADGLPGAARRSPGSRAARGRYWWLRWALLGVAVVVLAVEASLVRDQLAAAWLSLRSANGWWVLAAIAAAMAGR